MKPGRNDLCPCGSGKKYKNCHAEQTSEKMSTNRIGWIVTVVVAAGAISLLASLRGGEEKRPKGPEMAPPGSIPVSQMQTPAEQPPGDPPPGKVWSKEHGHWHDIGDPSQVQMSTTRIPITAGDLAAASGAQAAASGAPATATQTTVAPGSPQPPGPAPAGKVWSVEHGHWHDAPGAAAAADPAVPADLQPLMQPPSVPAAPEGMVWSEEHKHWHKADEDAKRKAAAQPNAPATTTQAPSP